MGKTKHFVHFGNNYRISISFFIRNFCLALVNKLKSLKVAQVKDEMDDDEDDGCDGVCDVMV